MTNTTTINSLFNQNRNDGIKIKFIKYITYSSEVESALTPPKDWKNIILLKRGIFSDQKSIAYDVMFAWDDNPDCGYVYLGHWNDGVV